jgi:protein phosphatase
LSLVPADFSLAVGSTTNAAGRPSNEDAIIARPVPSPASLGGESYLLAVADGMGGHTGGEVASKLAIDLLEDLFSREAPEDVAQSLKQAYRRANEVIYSQAGPDAGEQRMGTTLVSAVVRGKYATIANVGDSRAYLIRARQVTQITQDHSVVGEQVAKGQLTEAQARKSPQRNLVTHALGLAEALDRRMPSIYELTLLPEDRLLLCSDGFFDVLQPDDYVSTVLAHSPQDSALALASMAIERGTTDNVSAVVLEVSPSAATVQREQIGAEIASQPKTNLIFVQLAVLAAVILIALIAAGIYFYL